MDNTICINDYNNIINDDINININSECQELKNIKYKTMLLNGVPLKETKYSSNLKNLDKFLENEKTTLINEPWSKLNKTIKTQKLIDFSHKYSELNNLDENEKNILINFFKDCLDRKKLQRVKDVCYDKNSGLIKSIPALIYNKNIKHFTLKNIDKRISTLKSLAPKKSLHNTMKNKNISIDDSNNNIDNDNDNKENDDVSA